MFYHANTTLCMCMRTGTAPRANESDAVNMLNHDRRSHELLVVYAAELRQSSAVWCVRIQLWRMAGRGIQFSGGPEKPPQFTYRESKSEGETAGAASSSDVAHGGALVEEKVGDLFTCPVTASLAHCVSEDMRMGKGIAVLFKKKFAGVDELKAQDVKPGGVAVLQRDGRFVYYLVTKKKAHDLPTLETLHRSLVRMREHCRENRVGHVCMPMIACGLDRLQWRDVKRMLSEVFADGQTKVTVYRLES